MECRFYLSRDFVNHQTGTHPESGERIKILEKMLAPKFADQLVEHWPLQSRDVLKLCHSEECIARVERLAAAGGGEIDADTIVSRDSFATALEAVAAGIDAVNWVFASHDSRRAFLALRPPGHHATAHQSMGFCLFNNIAIAARYALKQKLAEKILIVDWDVHHGNGTQDIFYDSAEVFFFSIHKSPFYPGTGAATETGVGPGKGYTLNCPITFDLEQPAEILRIFAAGLEQASHKIQPDLILISAGFDGHKHDFLGNIKLSARDFAAMTRLVCDAANQHCQGRVISFLEGGYELSALADSVEQHFAAMLRH